VATQIDGGIYFMSGEVAKSVGVTRQTLWRWRSEGRIPAGRRYRGRHVMFTEAEVETIGRFAHRLEPVPSKTAPLGRSGLESASALPGMQEI
jgi:excisionase family DNA binding protein